MNIKAIVSNVLKSYLEKKGIIVIPKKRYDLLLSYPKLALKESLKQKVKDKVDSIIFSKDRAMQLNAFLESFQQNVEQEDGKLFILYKASTPEHMESYCELMNLYKGENYVFIEESDFREQLNTICNKSDAKVIAFYVDDMIFTTKVSYHELLGFDMLEYTPSLSRGRDLTYSQVLNKSIKVPKFKQVSNSLFEFSWHETDEVSDWTFPVGVSGYFYNRYEIVTILNNVDYKAPNSLEGAMNTCRPYFSTRKGLCLDKIACSCIHVNIVQTEGFNNITGHFTIEDLLAKWKKGYKIDISKFQGKGFETTYMKYDFIKR